MRKDVRSYTYLISLDLEQDIGFPQVKYVAIKPSPVLPDLCIKTLLCRKTLGGVMGNARSITSHLLKVGKIEPEKNYSVPLSFSSLNLLAVEVCWK